ncbi:MAG: hypothetical protein RL160_2073, partial [Bacteroidota bacterium]
LVAQGIGVFQGDAEPGRAAFVKGVFSIHKLPVCGSFCGYIEIGNPVPGQSCADAEIVLALVAKRRNEDAGMEL